MAHIPTRILVPIDFSAASDRALSMAKEGANGFGAEIHLIHVRAAVDDPAIDTAILDEVEQILTVSESKTRQALEQAGKHRGARVHAHIKRGSTPAASIVDAVSEYGCDLVMMGTHGRRGLKGLLLGSVAKEVTHRSPVPVVTTRAEADGASPPQRILVACDFSEHSVQSLCLAAVWARHLSAEVTLLHVVESFVYPEFYFDHAPDEENLERSIQRSHDYLARIAKDHLSGVVHETVVIHAPVAEGIAEYASINDFDLVVLATRGLSGVAGILFGSVAERVIQLSEVPVLTVRGKTPIPTDEPGRKSKSRTGRGTFRGSKTARTKREYPKSFSVERLPKTTVLRVHPRESLAGADLELLDGLWGFFDDEIRSPSPVIVVLAPPGLLTPSSLEKLLRGRPAKNGLSAKEVSERIIREENVIQRFIENVRGLDSFVVGVVGGEVAFQLAAPLLACDYRIVSSDTVFVNTTQKLPRAPLNCLPWLLAKMVGSAKASQLMLDVPRLAANDAHVLGLVNHMASPDRLEAEGLEVAGRLSTLPRATLMSLKRAIIASSEGFESYKQQELMLTQRLAAPSWQEN